MTLPFAFFPAADEFPDALAPPFPLQYSTQQRTQKDFSIPFLKNQKELTEI